MSNKRILPAFILAAVIGFLGVHRFYAGRYWTGLIQLILFCVGSAMLWPDLKSLEAVQSIEDYLDWTQSHPINPLPWLIIGIPCIWAIVDCYLLLFKKFRDRTGQPMTRWI